MVPLAVYAYRQVKNRAIISRYEQVKEEMRKRNINYKEAYHFRKINKLLKVKLLDSEKLAIAKSMSAYNITVHVAQRLHDLEIRNKCSSERILDFVEYCEEKKPNIGHLNEEGILKVMQNSYPYHHLLKIEKDYRYDIVEETLISENIRYLQANEAYQKLSYGFIKKIATHYVTRYQEGMTFEAIRKANATM